MNASDEIEADRSSHLSQARERTRRLHEVLRAHAADLVRHADSAERSASLSNSTKRDPVNAEVDVLALRGGSQRVRQAADAANRLLEGLTEALGDEEG